MNELRCKVLVIGGGPGGYVAAIRAGQLGLDTILVEANQLGGTCLNVGCIPSKALIHAAGAAHGLREPRALSAIGLSIGPPKLDFARTIAWKDAIVTRLTNGVGVLLKKAKVRTLLGHGDDRRRQDGDRQRRHWRDAHRRRASRPCDRLGAGGTAGAQVRRRHSVFDRCAGADRGSAIACGGRRGLYRDGARASLSPSSAPR